MAVVPLRDAKTAGSIMDVVGSLRRLADEIEADAARVLAAYVVLEYQPTEDDEELKIYGYGRVPTTAHAAGMLLAAAMELRA